ncbi:3'-5' exonuclease [Shigella flexneri]
MKQSASPVSWLPITSSTRRSTRITPFFIAEPPVAGVRKIPDAEPHAVQNFWCTSFFSRPEIKDLLAYLRVLSNPDDDSAFLRIVYTPKREIGFGDAEKAR